MTQGVPWWKGAHRVPWRRRGDEPSWTRCQGQEAFGRLRRKSMDTQRPMVEIAQAVILAAEVSGQSR